MNIIYVQHNRVFIKRKDQVDTTTTTTDDNTSTIGTSDRLCLMLYSQRTTKQAKLASDESTQVNLTVDDTKDLLQKYKNICDKQILPKEKICELLLPHCCYFKQATANTPSVGALAGGVVY